MPLILTISFRLRTSAPVDARGMAILAVLLGDGSGPCYQRIAPDELTVALQDVTQWLETWH